MLKIHHLKTVRTNSISISYFYTKEKADSNGNPRFKIYVIDPDAPAVYETIVKCYESQIKAHVINFIETAVNACS